MMDTKTLVDDALLRELSAETRKIGSRVLVKRNQDHPEFTADIMDVIVMPHTSFYRAKFMEYYCLYSHNSVKALKELSRTFPFIPDYQLGIAYMLNLEPDQESPARLNHIKVKSELEFNDETLRIENQLKERDPRIF